MSGFVSYVPSQPRLPTCGHCEDKKAVCVGQYADMDELEFACEDCCAHGNEDGECFALAGAKDSE